MGHPVLRQVADPLPPERIPDPDVQAFIDDMIATLRDYEGAGLAAPQVRRSWRIVVMAVDAESQVQVLINPEISFLTRDQVRSYEGCLSVPELRAAVNRVEKVRLQALDRDGVRVSMDLDGFAAIATQHEVDHLDGVLYVDRCDTRTLTHLDELRRFGPLDPGFRAPQAEPGTPSEPPPGEPPSGGDEPSGAAPEDQGASQAQGAAPRPGARGASPQLPPDALRQGLLLAGTTRAES